MSDGPTAGGGCWPLAINAVLLVGTFVGALLTGSLALLADTGHVLSDVAAIILGLVAGGLASPGGPRRTFGYQRTEVFAALRTESRSL